ncbi:MAG: RagB/SusD family nutrient uptake outer membrane protein [Tannerella sp.]|jgi:hypothetical protein|nr:RagB/SusD family nutrient uptake outer membrane protein [Tannerella sp.]
MNRYKFLAVPAAIGLALFLGTACTDLDEDVYDSLPADNFGNTMVEVNALMGTTYNTLKTYWSSNFMYLSECGGSMAVTPTRQGGDWYDGGQYREFYVHSWTSQTNMIKSSWSAASTAIGTCNATIEVLQNSTLLSDAEKTEDVASMRGLRDFWLYVMLDNWGNVPLVTSYEDKELPKCASRQEVFDFLIKDVTEIATQAPDGTYANYGKFTKGSAEFLLAKLYLNAEAWGVKVEGGNAYQKCVDACDKIMAMGYVLEPDWKTNFGISDRSREGILTITFSESDTQNQDQLMLRTLHYQDNYSDGASYSAWNGICAQPGYVQLFDTLDPRYAATFRIGLRRNKATGDTLYTQYGAPLIYTVDFSIIPGTERDGTPWGDVVQEAGARCQKWPYSTTLTSAMGNHFHIFRYSDVYLTKAEALLRSGGDVAEATKLVNAIRERAWGDDTHDYQTVTLKEVQLERKFEFAWEAWSRQDDIRFGTFDQAEWPGSNCTRIADTDGHLKLYPISQDAWQTNQNLVQNPGYAAFN